jgi:hypothetical protein
MSVLNTFVIKFKGDANDALSATKKVDDATKALKKTNEELLALQESMGKKVGKNLTDQEKQQKHLQEVQNKHIQAVKEAEKEQADRDKEKLKTGSEFVNIIEKATAAAAAYVSVAAVSNGIFSNAQSNSNLKVQADLLGQSLVSVKAIDAISQAAGGKEGAVLDQYNRVVQDYASRKQPVADIETYYRNLHEISKQGQYQGASGKALLSQQNYGLDAGQIDFIYKNDADFEKTLTKNKEKQAGLEKGAQAARDFQEALKGTGTSIDTVFTNLGTRVLPYLTELNVKIQEFAEYLNKHPHIADSLAIGITALATALGVGAVATIVGGIGAIGLAAAGAAAPFLALGAAVGGAVAVYNSLGEGREASDKNWAATHNGQAAPYLPIPGLTRGLRNNNPGNLRSWIGAGSSGGFAVFDTPEQGVNALSKQLQLYNGRGNNTINGIISKYAPGSENNTAAYIAAVARDTGFDPSAHLDISDPAIRSSLMAAIIKHENGSNPYSNKQIQALIGAGQQSIGTANTSQYGMTPIPSVGASNTANVKIGDIHVHTQATSSAEIASNISAELSKQLNHVTANSDNGLYA